MFSAMYIFCKYNVNCEFVGFIMKIFQNSTSPNKTLTSDEIKASMASDKLPNLKLMAPEKIEHLLETDSKFYDLLIDALSPPFSNSF